MMSEYSPTQAPLKNDKYVTLEYSKKPLKPTPVLLERDCAHPYTQENVALPFPATGCKLIFTTFLVQPLCISKHL